MNLSLVKLAKTFGSFMFCILSKKFMVILHHIDYKNVFLVGLVHRIDRRTAFQRPDLPLLFGLSDTAVAAPLEAEPVLAD